MIENNEILDDLLLWADSIRKKDEQLQNKKPIRDEALPPVRKAAKLVIDPFTKPVGLDYLKKKKATTKRVSTTVSSSSNDNIKKLQEKAREEKEKGNVAFQKQKYQEAISHYNQAVQYGQQSPPEICAVYYTNRAMAYLKILKFKEAEQDCTSALKLHPKNLKAAWRRGVARRGLNQLDDARQDFEMALKIEPGNKVVLEELKNLPLKKSKPAKSSSSKSTPKTEIEPELSRKPIASVTKSSTEEQKEKEKKGVERRRLSIKVVDEAYSDITTTTTTTTTTAPPSTPTIDSSSKIDTNAKTKTINELSKKNNKSIQEINNNDDKSIPTHVKSVDTTPKLPPIKFNVPKTNLEFERDWKTCRHRGTDVLYQYFQSIPTSSYPTLFRSSLDSDQFEQMLDLLESHYVKYQTEKEIYNVLEALGQVRRIDMLIMFLGNNHKQVLQRLFTRMKDKVDQNSLLKIAKIYDIK
ncbi:hypothetical protein BDC45DRAFT_572395 [Circinella umbellata]|nr:hypothetical protein BDC45DRAFT_572395 [Circinella umbellata]